jgi:hypothetical protein
MHSGKFSRTMQQAFGPYTSRQLSPMPEPIHPHDRIVLWGCAVAAVAAVVAFVAVVLL